jgi:hypothetical protein
MKALGSAAGAATLLRPLIAEAEGIVPPRFLYVHYPCGTVSGLTQDIYPSPDPKWYWFPRGASGANYTSPLLDLFSAVKGSILPIDGIDFGDRNQVINGEKHAQAMMFAGTGWMPVAVDGQPIDSQFDPPNARMITVPKGTKSIDQLLLDKVPALSTGPKFPSIQLCGTAKSMQGMGYTSLKVISYAGNGMPLFGEGRSAAAFNNLFSFEGPPVNPDVAARRLAQKRSVLDSVIADIQRMQPLLPVSQRPKLDAQLTAIRALEARIVATDTPPNFTKPVLIPEPTTGHDGANPDEARHEALITNMLEIIRCAFVSDLTRVASITFADGNNPLRPIAFCPNPGFTNNGDGHGVSNSGRGADALEAKGEMSAFYTRLMANALVKMAQTPEGGGSLLDNVLGMFFTECRNGDDNARTRIPIVLFGGKFLKLNTGQFLTITPNAYVNDIWASALTAWGVPTPTFGDPQYSRGPIPGLFG